MLLVRGNPLERVEESLGVVGVWREGWRARVWEGALERELEGLDAGGGSAQEEGKVGVVVVAEREGEVDLHEFD